MSQTVVTRPQAFSQRWECHLTKRILDVGICLLAMPFVLPLLALVILLICLDSPGPALFLQERIGRGGRRFAMLKFRTMHWNLDDTAHWAFTRAFVNGEVGQRDTIKGVYKPCHDSEVTRLGRFLRRTSLDELPQIFNVLKGEMSLVGPRPNVPWDADARVMAVAASVDRHGLTVPTVPTVPAVPLCSMPYPKEERALDMGEPDAGT